jgi:EAL domain-containing protein (putative c-di-GMP-specific phosphodiesterase class I)/CheY-like chemotaxis protein
MIIMHKDLSWLNVLVVDDSETILKYVRSVLTQTYKIQQIYTASSVPEAEQLLRHNKHINILFLDLNMPHTDGIQLIQRISKLEYSGYLVIMSGVSTRVISSVELLTKKYGLNYAGTLLKPMHEDDFLPIIDRLGCSKQKRAPQDSLKTYEIIRAIKNEDIEVLYQPQIDVFTRRFVAVEALCRLNHPRLGKVPPSRFIDKAEQSDLIVHITNLVLRRAIKDWKKCHQLGLNLEFSVNASPVALQQPEYADIIFNLLEEFQMPASSLCIEVTENILADDQRMELVNLNRLNMKGVKIALDDFGQENSTVDRLQKLPLNYLKLDKHYFIEQKQTLSQLSLINTSLSLASELNLKTIAEGIEDADTLSLITKLGCDYAQGYYISEPIPAKSLIKWSATWHSKT